MEGHNRRQSLMAIPQLLRYLSTYPDPQPVAEALLRGPFAYFDATSCNLLLFQEPDSLVMIGTKGLGERAITRYQVLSTKVDTPAGRSFRESEIVIHAISEMMHDFPAVQIDLPIWQEHIDRDGDKSIVCAPILNEGIAIGCFNFFMPIEHTLDTLDFSLINGISCLLGMWLSNPRTNTGLDANHDLTEDAAFTLNERQLRILQLVDEGRSNASIAVTLGYSQSTVKQELQRAMKVLRVNERSMAAAKARELGLQDA